MDNADIKRFVNEITDAVARTHGSPSAVRRLRTQNAVKYRAFAAKYPKLFDMCWDPSFDRAQFEFMMTRLEDVRAHRATLEESTQRVTDALNERYVIPLVGQATRSNDQAGTTEHIQVTCSGGMDGMSAKMV
jgi:hypothetical protein